MTQSVPDRVHIYRQAGFGIDPSRIGNVQMFCVLGVLRVWAEFQQIAAPLACLAVLDGKRRHVVGCGEEEDTGFSHSHVDLDLPRQHLRNCQLQLGGYGDNGPAYALAPPPPEKGAIC